MGAGELGLVLLLTVGLLIGGIALADDAGGTQHTVDVQKFTSPVTVQSLDLQQNLTNTTNTTAHKKIYILLQ